MKVTVRLGDRVFEVEVEDASARPVIARIGQEQFEVWPETATDGAPPCDRAAPATTSGSLLTTDTGTVLAPLPGVVVSLSAQPGSPVKLNQELCVLEAMKMRMAVYAPRDGRVAAVRVRVGQHVKQKEVLLTYEPG
jgi:biotin carboxyl carrier protein